MASTGWVSFDDDNGGSGFGFGAPTAPAPAASGVAPASAPTGWAQQFAVAGPATSVTAQYPVPAPLAAAVLPGPAPSAPAAAAGPAAGLMPEARDHQTSPAAAPPTASPPSVFPSFAALYGAGSAPAAAAGFSDSAPPSTSAPGCASTSGPVASLAADPAAAASAVQRLPRPPTSAARGSVPPAAAGAANPFGSLAAPPAPTGLLAPGGRSNPFAAAAANPAAPTAAAAAARSLDPFADLSLRPALPRPPPMGSSRSPTTSSAASTTGAGMASLGPSPAGALGQAADPGAGAASAGLQAAQAGAAGLPGALPAGPGPSGAGRGLMRPPASASAPAAPAPAPAAATAPVAAPAPPPAFPTFAALHHHQQQQQHRPAAQQPPFLDAAPTAAGPGAGPGAASTPQASATRQVSGPLSGPDQGGVIKTTTFDAFLPGTKSPPSPPQRQPNVPEAAPPPPPYAVAVNLPDAAAPSVLGGGVAVSPHGLPPPPPYVEALHMPDAQPPAALPPQPPPPPSYDEAVALPAAEHTLDRSVRPLPRSDSTRQPEWAAFDDDVFGLHAAARAGPAATAAPPAAPPAPAKAPAAAPPPLPDQICVEVRLPPLKPKEAAWPKRLVAGMGLMFAAPGGDGVAALQWWLHAGAGAGAGGAGPGQDAAQRHAPAQGHVAGPHFALPPGQAVGRSTEDADSAPAASVALPADLAATCCMLLDDVSGSLWTGHKDGRVVRWAVEPGRTAAYEHHWRAHIRGKITHLALSPWGDLWTASSGGTIRAWQYQTGLPASRPPNKLFECRRCCRAAMGPAARSSAQRAHSKARLLCLGPSGRVMWSAGRTGMALWSAYDGDFLGTLTPGLVPGQEARAGGAAAGATGAVYAGDTGAMGGAQGQQQQLEINPQTGLDASVISRPFSPRLPLDPSEDAEGADRDPDLGVQVMKGLAGAAKLAVRLGKKLRQNIVESTGVGAASEVGGASEMYGVSPGSRGKVVALLAGLDACVYVAYQRGWLDKYTEWGKLLWSRDYGRHVELRSAALVGAALWLGCSDGAIRTASAASGELGGAWKAADFPVVALAHDAGPTGRGSGLVFSLSENGSVRGWPAVPPSEAQRLAWRNGLLPSLRPHKLTVLAATWNVNETRPAPASLRKWLQPAAEAAADIVSISLQEVEMGTSSVAWDAAVTLLSKSTLERGNQNAQWWSTELSEALKPTGGSWERVALRQMSGLVIVVFCRRELMQHVGEVATANVACGVMGVGGNKGAVAVSMTVFRRRVMFVCSHFAAHQERVEERNENYNKIVRLLHFDNTSKAAAAQQLQQQQQQQAGDASGPGGSAFDSDADASGTPASRSAAAAGTGTTEGGDDGHGPGLSDAALLVWAGDFNYRLNGTYEEVCELSCTGALGKLFKLDQCRIEMEKGNVFRGLREPLPLCHPVFVPTYKYDKNEPHKWIPPAEPGGAGRLQLPFDSSEKQRVPAWTDRVFYRGSRPGSLDVAEEEVCVIVGRPADYNCVLEVTDSDHKPVFAVLQVQLPGYEQEQKRRHSLASALAVHTAALSAPGGHGMAAAAQLQQLVRASVSRLELRPFITSVLDIQNVSSATFKVHVMAERRAGLASGPHTQLASLPSWLEVSPTTFSLGPRQEDGYGGAGGDGAPGHARVHLRVLGGDCTRATEPLQLRFVLRPLWGCGILAGAPGPVVSLTVR